jgi:hypothetical protein
VLLVDVLGFLSVITRIVGVVRVYYLNELGLQLKGACVRHTLRSTEDCHIFEHALE